MEKKQIVTVTTTGLSKTDGISSVILDYYSQIDKEQYELYIIAAGDYDTDLVNLFCQKGIHVMHLPCRKSNLTSYLRRLFSMCNQMKFDTLYIHGSSSLMAMELFIAKMCGIPSRVVHSHNTTCNHKLLNKLLRPVFNKLFTQALACGHDAGVWLYNGKPFNIIRNCRDVEKYRFSIVKRTAIRKMMNVENDTFVIGHVGNFNMQKNQNYIVEVIRTMVEKGHKVKLFLVGDGMTKTDVEEQVKIYKLDDFVEFTGTVSNVPEILQGMDAMILPSLFEGLPLVAVEWQIANLPCVISDNVTSECAFTDLVSFKSLDDGYEAWAEALLKYKDFDRNNGADEVLQSAISSGYDLRENVKRLLAYL